MTQFLLIFSLPRFSLAFFRGPCFFSRTYLYLIFEWTILGVSFFKGKKSGRVVKQSTTLCLFFHVREMWVRILEAMGDEQWTMHIQIQGIHLSHINSSIYFFLHIPIHFIYTRSHPETRKKVSENANDWNIIFREMAAFVLYGPHTHTPLLHSTGFLKNVENGVQI